jgi:RNA polymerase sigma-70 factor (ECF subfamily)
VDIDAWYHRYGESVYRRCLRLSRNEQQALDLTQEVFLRAHRYRESYRATGRPLAWLFTLADRCFFDAIDNTQSVPLDEVKEFAERELEGFEQVFCDHDLVARLLIRVPEDVRAIVVHRYFDELDLEAIAERLSIDERTVRRKLQRFLERAHALAKEAL